MSFINTQWSWSCQASQTACAFLFEVLANEGWIVLPYLSIYMWSVLYLYWNTHWSMLNMRNSDVTSFSDWHLCVFHLTHDHGERKEVNTWGYSCGQVLLYKGLLYILADCHSFIVAAHWFINGNQEMRMCNQAWFLPWFYRGELMWVYNAINCFCSMLTRFLGNMPQIEVVGSLF